MYQCDLVEWACLLVGHVDVSLLSFDLLLVLLGDDDDDDDGDALLMPLPMPLILAGQLPSHSTRFALEVCREVVSLVAEAIF